MNANTATRSHQLLLGIEADIETAEIAGSPAVLEPWVRPEPGPSLEIELSSAGPRTGFSLSAEQPGNVFRQPMTSRQQGFLYALARELGWSASDVHTEATDRFGVASVNELDRWQASEMIRLLQERPPLPVAS